MLLSVGSSFALLTIKRASLLASFGPSSMDPIATGFLVHFHVAAAAGGSYFSRASIGGPFTEFMCFTRWLPFSIMDVAIRRGLKADRA